jgi:lysophospholipase L1-like esterase
MEPFLFIIIESVLAEKTRESTMNAGRRLVFVALGDSLTRGFQPYDPSSPFGYDIPYTDFLDNLIITELSRNGIEDIDVNVINLGINGDTTRGMLGRFDRQVAPKEPDYVIILGGINDLFMGVPPESIMGNLMALYERTRQIGATPMACTLTSVLGFEPVIPLIQDLNGMIETSCRREGIPLADLYEGTSDGEGSMLEAYSSDGAHLNREGYERMANVIFEDVVRSIIDSLEH